MCNKFISETHPHLLNEWDYEKNTDLSPETLTYGSSKRVWWVCCVCGESWRTTVWSRTVKMAKCPHCRRIGIRKASDAFSAQGLELLDTFYINAHIKMKYRCVKCGYEGVKTTAKVLAGSGCLACAGKVVTNNNSLAAVSPDIAAEWAPRNENTPSAVHNFSNSKAWWVCSECGHEWETNINNRTSRCSGCPVCSRGQVSSIGAAWLDFMAVPKEFREYSLEIGAKKYRVDAYNPNTNTVYEFFGDYWHGNPAIYNQEDINPSNGETFGALYGKTMARVEELKKAGYSVVYVWECDFNRKDISSGKFAGVSIPYWVDYFLNIAEAVSARSSCMRTKVGCIAVKNNQIVSTGYNGAPVGRNTCFDLGYCYRNDFDIKSGTHLELCAACGAHAESNCITQAAKHGISVEGAVFYLYGHSTCCTWCQAMLLNAGVKAIYMKDSIGRMRMYDVVADFNRHPILG